MTELGYAEGVFHPGLLTTYRGPLIPLLDLKPEHIDPIDIAHSLGNQVRYNGHVNQFYSVAQHSMLVAKECSPENKKWALLHDAAEAYTGDMIGPLKHLPEAQWFRDLEDKIMREAVCPAFGLDPEQPEEVTYWDHFLCTPEMRDIKGRPFECDYPYIAHMEPQEAIALYKRAMINFGILPESRMYE